MTREKAAELLADTVAEYVENHFPLQYLTGEQGGGVPDEDNAKELQNALFTLGYKKAATQSYLMRAAGDE